MMDAPRDSIEEYRGSDDVLFGPCQLAAYMAAEDRRNRRPRLWTREDILPGMVINHPVRGYVDGWEEG